MDVRSSPESFEMSATTHPSSVRSTGVPSPSPYVPGSIVNSSHTYALVWAMPGKRRNRPGLRGALISPDGCRFAFFVEEDIMVRASRDGEPSDASARSSSYST